jgi:hypothetical protein
LCARVAFFHDGNKYEKKKIPKFPKMTDEKQQVIKFHWPKLIQRCAAEKTWPHTDGEKRRCAMAWVTSINYQNLVTFSVVLSNKTLENNYIKTLYLHL